MYTLLGVLTKKLLKHAALPYLYVMVYVTRVTVFFRHMVG